MLPKIFTSITRNTRALETNLQFTTSASSHFVSTNSSRSANTGDSGIGVGSHSQGSDTNPSNGIDIHDTRGTMLILSQAIHQKIKLFKTMRTAVVVYLGSILLVNSLRIVMVWYLEWLNYLLNETVVFTMMGFISWFLSPKNRLLFSRFSFSADGRAPANGRDNVYAYPLPQGLTQLLPVQMQLLGINNFNTNINSEDLEILGDLELSTALLNLHNHLQSEFGIGSLTGEHSTTHPLGMLGSNQVFDVKQVVVFQYPAPPPIYIPDDIQPTQTPRSFIKPVVPISIGVRC